MKDHVEKVAQINFKQAIMVAGITAITTITVTLISTGTFNKKPDKSQLDNENCSTCQEQVNELNEQLNNSVSTSTFEALSNQYFGRSSNIEIIIDSLRQLIEYADELKEHQNHYTFKLFLIKKIMLNKPRRNVNTRIDDDKSSTYKIIQQILKEIEIYEGPINGDRMKTYFALEKFQKKINTDNPDYFNPDNYGIFGNATLVAIRRLHEIGN